MNPVEEKSIEGVRTNIPISNVMPELASGSLGISELPDHQRLFSAVDLDENKLNFLVDAEEGVIISHDLSSNAVTQWNLSNSLVRRFFIMKASNFSVKSLPFKPVTSDTEGGEIDPRSVSRRVVERKIRQFLPFDLHGEVDAAIQSLPLSVDQQERMRSQLYYEVEKGTRRFKEAQVHRDSLYQEADHTDNISEQNAKKLAAEKCWTIDKAVADIANRRPEVAGSLMLLAFGDEIRLMQLVSEFNILEIEQRLAQTAHRNKIVPSYLMLRAGMVERTGFERMATMTEEVDEFVDYIIDSAFGGMIPQNERKKILQSLTDEFKQYQDILQQAYPGRDYVITKEEIEAIYRNNIETVLENDPDAVIVINDRYIARSFAREYPHQLFRVSSTRNLNRTNSGLQSSNIMPRPGEPAFDQQLDNIDYNLRMTGKGGLFGAHIVLGDDMAYTHTTEYGLSELFQNRDALVELTESMYVYKGFPVGQSPDWMMDRSNSGAWHIDKCVTGEVREFTPLGGPLIRVGEHVGLQRAAQFPWSNGAITRTEGLLQRLDLDYQMLDVFDSILAKTESALEGRVRADESVFEGFTFADVRWMIPAGKDFGPSELIREYKQMYNQTPGSLADLNFRDYLKLAKEKLNQQPLPHITHAIVDIDGTLLEMKYGDAFLRKFSGSHSGEIVLRNMDKLVNEFVSDEMKAEQYLDTLDIENPVQFLQKHQDFSDYLEEKYGGQVQTAMKQRFIDFYGSDKGPIELKSFLEKYSFLPFSYHVFREKTWGQIDIDVAYEQDLERNAVRFIESIDAVDGTVVLLTAGPRIHTMKMLEKLHIAKYIRSGKIALATVEDLYDHQSLEELPKSIILEHIIASGIQPWNILSIGDQKHSDIDPAVELGAYGFLVNGPNTLMDVFRYAEFPNDIAQTACLMEMGCHRDGVRLEKQIARKQQKREAAQAEGLINSS